MQLAIFTVGSWPDSAIQLPQYLLIANGCFTGLILFCRFL
jgi:hypothetical protein